MYENNEFDLSGWDIKKCLNLLWKSNPPLLEQIQSPIIYISHIDFLSNIQALAQSTYSKIATMHHYLSMSKKMYSEVASKDSVKLKRLFYALRAATACKWIEEMESIPPIVFQKMLEELDININIKNKIIELIELKSTRNEDYLHTKEVEINLFIEQCIDQAEKNISSLPSSKGNIEELNLFFIEQLK
jgi:predicted nucleotidyltransferase